MDESQLVVMLAKLRPHLNERQWRLLLGGYAQVLGRGGISKVATLTGSHPDTVARGARELEQGIDADRRVRRTGAGRKAMEEADPQLVEELKALVSSRASGDPVHPLLWTTKSTRHLSDALIKQGRVVGADTVGRLLKERLGFSLRGNAKTVERGQNRDAQFLYINDLAAWCLAAGIPVINVSCKKRKAAVGGDWTSAGTDRQTAAFAAESIHRWWRRIGAPVFPGARQLVVTADCVAAKGDQQRAWKLALAKLAIELRIEITVAHLPPGAWKWDHVEHRLSSAVSTDRRGRAMESHEVIIETICADTHRGRIAEINLDNAGESIVIEITDTQVRQTGEPFVQPHELQGDWNYCFAGGGSTGDGAAAIT
jgi:transposase